MAVCVSIMSSKGPHPLAVALDWVGRIVAVGLEMVLPGAAGHWLDRRFGTSYLAILGFALGMTVGIWHLLVMTRPPSPPKRSGQD
jgi:hypothetical protein